MGFSRVFRNRLILGAILLALLPIPVTAVGALPAYRVQALFLFFYTPLVCLLALAYLFYVREYLGRWMFADLLAPLPDPDPYSPSRTSEAFTRVMRGFRRVVLAVLPAVLVAASFYSFTCYTTLLTESVRLVAAARGHSSYPPRPPVQAPPSEDTVPASERVTLGASAPSGVVVSDSLRREILETTRIDRIPLFTELSLRYIAIFISALIAVGLFAVKENAKETLGLTEEDILVGPPRGLDRGDGG